MGFFCGLAFSLFGPAGYLGGYLCIGSWNVCFLYTVVVFTVGCRSNLQHYLPNSCKREDKRFMSYNKQAESLVFIKHSLQTKVTKCLTREETIQHTVAIQEPMEQHERTKP